MKTGFLLFLAIALTIFGVYFSWQIKNREAGGNLQPPAAVNVISELVNQTTLGVKDIQGKVEKFNEESKARPEQRPEDQEKIKILNEVLASGNDNDPRLDKELRDLGDGARQLMRSLYKEIPKERRNDLGTVVFLLGRSMSQLDVSFMSEVLREEPCRSLQNCKEDPPRSDHAHLHEEIGMDVTLVYPQLVALKSLEKILERGSGDPLYGRAWDAILTATNAPTEQIALKAKEVLARFPRRGGRN